MTACLSTGIRRFVPLVSAAVLALACQTESVQPPRDTTLPADDRTRIVMPEAGRAMILGEMRVMLASVSQFLSASLAGDTAKMHTAASTAGMKVAIDIQPAMRAQLPAEFLQIGEGTHAAFDSLATMVSAGASRDAQLGQLSGIIGRCVSCHSAYRLEVAR